MRWSIPKNRFYNSFEQRNLNRGLHLPKQKQILWLKAWETTDLQRINQNISHLFFGLSFFVFSTTLPNVLIHFEGRNKLLTGAFTCKLLNNTLMSRHTKGQGKNKQRPLAGLNYWTKINHWKGTEQLSKHFWTTTRINFLTKSSINDSTDFEDKKKWKKQ